MFRVVGKKGAGMEEENGSRQYYGGLRVEGVYLGVSKK